MVLQTSKKHVPASDAGDSQDRRGVDCGGGTGISFAIRAGDGAGPRSAEAICVISGVETINASALIEPTH